MNSRFKFVQTVDPQPIPTNAIKPKFSKLTLATSKLVAVQSKSVQKDANVQQTTQTVTSTTTTTTTTMTKVLNDRSPEKDAEEIPCAQQPRLLLYESTKDENVSDILTDDDTDSVGSSIDSQEIEAGLKEISQPTQDTVANIQRIDTQMQNLSFMSPTKAPDMIAREDECLHDISRQLDQLDLDNGENNKTEGNNEIEANKDEKNNLSCSIQTLSSNDTLDEQPDANQSAAKTDSDVVIILSDSEENDESIEDIKRNISKDLPLMPTVASCNDGAVYNISPLDSPTMQKVNNFFDAAPFFEPVNRETQVDSVENSLNGSHVSNSTQNDVYVPETTDEESVIDNSIGERSIADANNEKGSESHQPEKVTTEKCENNIFVDIPVIKSTSDQPRQLIRSQSGVRLKASHSSPIIKTSTGMIESDLRITPGNVIRVNSNNGQVSIAAKININIQILEDSSDASSEDNKPTRKSQAIQSSEDCQSSKEGNDNDNEHSSQMDVSGSSHPESPMATNSPPKSTPNGKEKGTPIRTPKRTPAKHWNSAAPETPKKTPSTASKIKQFEFVPPRSMTKTKKTDAIQSKQVESKQCETETQNKSVTSSTSENSDGDGFKVDRSIPISPRDQKLMHKVYGDAWKTPEVIRSYSAVKGKPKDRAAVNGTPTLPKSYRYSKGFDLFKQKMKTDLNSTRMDDQEISMIEAPAKDAKMKAPPVTNPQLSTPQSKGKCPSAKKRLDIEASPSVLTKKRLSPQSTKKYVGTPDATVRPVRNVRRKKIVYTQQESESEKENESDWSDDDSYSDSDVLTEDENDSDKGTKRSPKPKSVRKNTSGGNTSKRPSKKGNKDELVYLDLSSEEVAQVEANHHGNSNEEALANITRKFLETDLNDEEKPKKTGRKLFTHQYDYVDDIVVEEEPRSVKKKPVDEIIMDIDIPRFTHKLFDGKKFGSPTINKTPNSKIKLTDFKTPNISKVLAERKTPFGSAKSKLDSPPKVFETYGGFLRSLDVQASMMLCHPDAKKYRDNFKAHKEELTTILYEMYNEKVFDNKLYVDILWNKKLTTTAGRFHGIKKSTKLTGKNNRVELSEKVLSSADRLRCTLIHELCHAATWIFDNDKGHGAKWKSWAKKANTVFPELPTISVCHNYDIEYKYTYKCDMCHSKSLSHSKSRKVENIRCSYCHGTISIYLNKKKDGKTVLEPVREATGFAKFVKAKYKDHKKPGVTHADVMRQISTEYATLSQEEKKNF